MRALQILLQDTIRLSGFGGKSSVDLPIHTPILRPKHPNNCLSTGGVFREHFFFLYLTLNQSKKHSWVIIIFFFKFDLEMQTLTQLPWLLGVSRLTTLSSQDRSTGKSWTNPTQHTAGVKEQPPPFLSLFVPSLMGSRKAAGIGKSLPRRKAGAVGSLPHCSPWGRAGGSERSQRVCARSRVQGSALAL